MNKFDMVTVGKRIRYYRVQKGYTQKELATRSHLSEPAIRNYELGNRTPSKKHIEAIANALDISYYAIAELNLEIDLSIIHTLFLLEERIGLHPKKIDDKIVLECSNLDFDYIKNWYDAYSKNQSGEYTEEDYTAWKSEFPEYITINTKKKLPSKR